MTSVEVAGRQPMSTARQILLNVYWFPINMIWASILLIVMPRYIQSVVGDSARAMVLGLALSVGAIVSMFAAPVFGALSDRVHLPGGRRKPWIVVGTLGIVFGLWAMSYWTRLGDPTSLPGWIGAFLVLELLSNIATAPCCALIPDQVPVRQRGSAAGWLGLMLMIGIFAGGATGFLIPVWGIASVYTALAVVTLIGALVTVLGVRESTGAPPRADARSLRDFLRSLYLPFERADFRWVFFNRVLIGMGIYTIQEFISYYLADAFKPPYVLPFFGKVADTAGDATSFFFPILFVGAFFTSFLAGALSDRLGRKPIAYAAGLALGFVCMVFTFSHSFLLTVLVGTVFGLGYGAYESVSWALASDVLPSARDHGKDMGLWHMAVALPQVVATPIGGFLLDHFQAAGAARNVPGMGYIVIFVIAVVYFMLGSIGLKQIKGLS
ncbi:MAG: MFS transporter [Anaerolineales bacterium]